jgi:hypothetical protein
MPADLCNEERDAAFSHKPRCLLFMQPPVAEDRSTLGMVDCTDKVKSCSTALELMPSKLKHMPIKIKVLQLLYLALPDAPPQATTTAGTGKQGNFA